MNPKMVDDVWKGVYLKVFCCTKQISRNKFYHQSTPSMRKGHNVGKSSGRKMRGGDRNNETTIKLPPPPPGKLSNFVGELNACRI